jgi:Family of unknown function (DUF6049)
VAGTTLAVAGATSAVAATSLVVAAGLPLASAGSSAAAAAPLGQYASSLTFDVTDISPQLVRADTPTVTISGTMRNVSSMELESIVARIQRGARFTSPEAVRAEMADPGQPESTQTAFGEITDRIGPGESRPFSVSAPVFEGRAGLGVDTPGVYPIMLNVNAEFAQGPSNGARVGELHALLTVVGVPGRAAPVVGTAQPMTMLVPLADRPHRSPTGAFYDDALVPLISPGGRLDAALRAAEAAASAVTIAAVGAPLAGAAPITLAVDPELLEELSLMRDGYVVGANVLDLTQAANPPTTTAPALPTGSTVLSTPPNGPTGGGSQTTDPGTGPPSGAGTPSQATTTAGAEPTGTTSTTPPVLVPGPSTVPGTGAGAATMFLNRLVALAARTPLLVLPYSDLDVTAVVRNGHGDQVATALRTGLQIATETLGSTARLVSDIAWPIDGYADDATLDALDAAGVFAVVLARGATEAITATDLPTTTINLAGGSVAALTGDEIPGSPLGINAFTALAAQNYFSNAGLASVYSVSRSRPVTPALTDVLAQLTAAGVVTGRDLAAIAQLPGGTARTAYPDVARARELSRAHFAGIEEAAASIRSVQEAFTPPEASTEPGSAPSALLTPLADGLILQSAGGYRAAGGEAQLALGAVHNVLDSLQNGVAINVPAGNYTLTSTSSPLVVSLRNDLPYNTFLRVRVNQAAAALAGITVTDPGLQAIPAGRSVQVVIPAEINRAGYLSVPIELTTPDGRRWGAEKVLQMRSTAYGAFTVTMIVVAAVIVVLTSALRIYKLGRERRARIAAGLQ